MTIVHNTVLHQPSVAAKQGQGRDVRRRLLGPKSQNKIMHFQKQKMKLHLYILVLLCAANQCLISYFKKPKYCMNESSKQICKSFRDLQLLKSASYPSICFGTCTGSILRGPWHSSSNHAEEKNHSTHKLLNADPYCDPWFPPVTWFFNSD